MKLITLLTPFLLVSCTAYHYVAPPNYVPVNTKKGDFQANCELTSIQVGYAFSNHFSLFTGCNYHNRSMHSGIFTHDDNSEDTLTCHYRIVENKISEINLGLSYFNTINSKMCFEIVAGLGKGKVMYSNSYQYYSDSDTPNDYTFTFNSQKVTTFVQPDFTFKIEKFLDFTVFTRLNFNRYYNIISDLNKGTGYYTYAIKTDKFFFDKKTANLCFLEPGFQIRLGPENVKFTYICSMTHNLLANTIRYRKMNNYLGISLTFNLEKNND